MSYFNASLKIFKISQQVQIHNVNPRAKMFIQTVHVAGKEKG